MAKDIYSLLGCFGAFIKQNKSPLLSRFKLNDNDIAYTVDEDGSANNGFAGKYVIVTDRQIVVFFVDKKEISETCINRDRRVWKVIKKSHYTDNLTEYPDGEIVNVITLDFYDGGEISFFRPAGKDKVIMGKEFDKLVALIKEGKLMTL